MLELKDINKKFILGDNEIHVLKDVNLNIEAGEFISIIGQSGSGKSTLMNIIGCIDTPSSGSYKIEGRETANLSGDELAALRSKKFGFVFQKYNLIATMDATANVSLPAVYAGVGASERSKRAVEILNKLELGDRTKSLPSKLSGGQQQRVSIARALINGGEVILADEPTGNLDLDNERRVIELFRRINSEMGITIISVTHSHAVAEGADMLFSIIEGDVRQISLDDSRV